MAAILLIYYPELCTLASTIIFQKMKCSNFQSISSSPFSLPQHHRNNKRQILITNKPCVLKVNGNGMSLTSRVPALPSTILLATTSLPAAKFSVLLKTGFVNFTSFSFPTFFVTFFYKFSVWLWFIRDGLSYFVGVFVSFRYFRGGWSYFLRQMLVYIHQLLVRIFKWYSLRSGSVCTYKGHTF